MDVKSVLTRLKGLFSKLDDHSEGLKGLFLKLDDHSEGLKGLFPKLDDHSEGLKGIFWDLSPHYSGQNDRYIVAATDSEDRMTVTSLQQLIRWGWKGVFEIFRCSAMAEHLFLSISACKPEVAPWK